MSITRIQSVSGGIDNTTLTKTLGAPPANGSLVVVSASFYNNNALAAPTVGGFTCTPSFTPQDSAAAGGDFVAQWWVIIPSTAPNGNVVFSTSNYYEVSAVEYSSTTGWPANPVTASGATPSKPTGTSNAPSASLTTTAADCVIVSNFSNGGDSNGDNGTPAATGYTRDYTAVFSEGGAGASKIVTSAGSQSATHSVASSIPWACAIVAYAAVAGGVTAGGIGTKSEARSGAVSATVTASAPGTRSGARSGNAAASSLVTAGGVGTRSGARSGASGATPAASAPGTRTGARSGAASATVTASAMPEAGLQSGASYATANATASGTRSGARSGASFATPDTTTVAGGIGTRSGARSGAAGAVPVASPAGTRAGTGGGASATVQASAPGTRSGARSGAASASSELVAGGVGTRSGARSGAAGAAPLAAPAGTHGRTRSGVASVDVKASVPGTRSGARSGAASASSELVAGGVGTRSGARSGAAGAAPACNAVGTRALERNGGTATPVAFAPGSRSLARSGASFAYTGVIVFAFGTRSGARSGASYATHDGPERPTSGPRNRTVYEPNRARVVTRSGMSLSSKHHLATEWFFFPFVLLSGDSIQTFGTITQDAGDCDLLDIGIAGNQASCRIAGGTPGTAVVVRADCVTVLGETRELVGTFMVT